MLGIFGLFLQAAAGHILYLALHLESGSFPRPLPPDRERAAFADLQKGGAAAAQARDTLIRHNLRLVAHICKKYYAGNSAQDDMISIGTIGLIKAVKSFSISPVPKCVHRTFTSLFFDANSVRALSTKSTRFL